MSDYVPTPAFVEREYVTGRLRRSDVTAPEARAAFARMIAEVERAAAEKALNDAASVAESLHAYRGSVEQWAGREIASELRRRAEAYRQGKEEQ